MLLVTGLVAASVAALVAGMTTWAVLEFVARRQVRGLVPRLPGLLPGRRLLRPALARSAQDGRLPLPPGNQRPQEAAQTGAAARPAGVAARMVGGQATARRGVARRRWSDASTARTPPNAGWRKTCSGWSGSANGGWTRCNAPMTPRWKSWRRVAAAAPGRDRRRLRPRLADDGGRVAQGGGGAARGRRGRGRGMRPALPAVGRRPLGRTASGRGGPSGDPFRSNSCRQGADPGTDSGRRKAPRRGRRRLHAAGALPVPRPRLDAVPGPGRRPGQGGGGAASGAVPPADVRPAGQGALHHPRSGRPGRELRRLHAPGRLRRAAGGQPHLDRDDAHRAAPGRPDGAHGKRHPEISAQPVPDHRRLQRHGRRGGRAVPRPGRRQFPGELQPGGQPPAGEHRPERRPLRRAHAHQRGPQAAAAGGLRPRRPARRPACAWCGTTASSSGKTPISAASR